jgi:DNA-binding NtrC family response regulator
MRALETYPFPGNVRELENILQCAAVLAAGEEIGLADLPVRVRKGALASSGRTAPPGAASDRGVPDPSEGQEPQVDQQPPPKGPTEPSPEELPLNLEALERWAVERAVRARNGRLTEAAKALGIGRTTLYRKLEKYGLR